ncbi:MAG: hypothetical protein RIA08_17615 [Roseovarius sp.]|uniref:hypothetical protein n=1 Tax=Roseovarius sp. TaxID=1486281 RepID=UPI0032EEB371
MFNPYAIGFVCVAASFVVGADYVVQAKANGSFPGEYAFSEYVGSYNARLGETVSAIDTARRQSKEAHIHLPEAPEGWERRAWKDPNPDADEKLAGLPLTTQMAVRKELKKAAQVALFDTWDYVRGDEMVRLSARYIGNDSEGRGIVALGHLVSESFYGSTGPTYVPYAVVQGVPFFEVTGEDVQGGAQLALEAFIGEDILIGVAANAEADTVRAFLELIDYDSLNLMLDEPVAGVGSAAPALTTAEELQLAESAAALRYGEKTLAPTTGQGEADAAPEPEAPAATVVKLNGGNALGQRTEDSGVSRLQLSGGRSCLGASSGRLCD